MFVRLHFQTIFHLSLAISHSFFERKFCKELRTYIWKENLLPDIMSCQKTWIISEHFCMLNESTSYLWRREKRPMFSLITNFATFHCYCKKNISSLETRLNPECTMCPHSLSYIFNVHLIITAFWKILIVTMNPCISSIKQYCNVFSTLAI